MPGQLQANGKPRTGDYRQNRFRFWQHYRDLPLFSFAMIQWMLQDSTVRLGLGMREAAVCQAEFAYKDGQKWVPGVRASSEEVGQFVLSQLRLWWTHHVQKMAQAQVWGWSAAEVTYTARDGLYEIHRTLHRHPEDVTPLLRGGELAGVRFKRVKTKGHVDVEFPYAYWHAFNPVAESNYGDPITRGCYCAWADKQLDGGAMDVLRLFMTKDAYGGMRIYYPEEEVFIQGDQRPNRDLAMEMVEQAKSGQVVTAPSARDSNGQRLWEFEDARVSSNPQHILQYPKDLDVYILRGMEIADDVLTSESTGAWQGKQVPMQAFYSAMDRWLAQIVRTFDEQILRTLVTVNFGPEADYELETKPLAEQAMEMAGAGEQDPQSQGTQQPPMQFSLDRGTVDAARLVQAARKVLDRGKRLQSDCGASGANPAPGFQYGNTCWKLTGKHKDALRKLTEQRELRRQEEAEEERERVLQEKFDELGRDLEEMERQELEGELEAEEKALKKAEDRKFRRSKMFRDIAETLETDDFEIVSDFRGLMEDLHKMLSDSAQAYNDVFDELVDQIVGKDIKGRQKRGAFVSGLKRAADPTRVPKFDEVVQYVRDNPEAQAVLATNLGESVGAGDLEAMVFEGLKRGKRPVPSLNSDETWNAALEYLGSVEPFEKTGEPVPFSIERLRRIVAYRFANAPKGGVTIAGKFFKGGQFIPKEVLAQATAEEMDALESGEQLTLFQKTELPLEFDEHEEEKKAEQSQYFTPELNAKREAVIAAGEKHAGMIAKIDEKAGANTKEWEDLMRRRGVAVEMGFKKQADAEFVPKMKELISENKAMWSKRAKLKADRVKKALRPLALPREQQTQFNVKEWGLTESDTVKPKVKHRSILQKASRVLKTLGALVDREVHSLGEGAKNVFVAENKTGRAFASANTIAMSKHNTDEVYAHEAGHVLEGSGLIQKMCQQFRDKRVRGEKKKKLNEFEPGRGYRDDEETLGADDWGKLVKGVSTTPAEYIGKVYPHGSTEVLSVGVEMLFTDPVHFAKTDPEYFHFVVGILDGSLVRSRLR